MKQQKDKFPILATLLALVSISILIALGTWQLQRLSWKNQLIENTIEEYKVDASQKRLNFNDFISLQQNDIRRGFVDGTFLYDKEITVGPRRLNGILGSYVHTPLALSTGGIVLVNRGWIPTKSVPANLRKETFITGSIRVVGTVKKSKRPWNFGPQNAPKLGMWIYMDIEQYANAMNLPQIAPAILFAEKTMPHTASLYQGEENWMPSNKHLGYALFWFALAGALAFIYYLRFWKR